MNFQKISPERGSLGVEKMAERKEKSKGREVKGIRRKQDSQTFIIDRVNAVKNDSCCAQS